MNEEDLDPLIEVVNINGFVFRKEDFETIQVCYPGGMFDSEKFVNSIMSRAVDELVELTALRESLAVSGAMRWPWSQEARITRSRYPGESTFTIS
jgi:hypothetical protein